MKCVKCVNRGFEKIKMALFFSADVNLVGIRPDFFVNVGADLATDAASVSIRLSL